MITVGVDLAKRKSQYAVLDEPGTVLAQLSLPNQRELVQKFLRQWPKPLQVACETCPNTYWLVDTVEELGLPLSVGHALKLKLIAESRIKTDRIDARVIAELRRVNFFPAIAIPPKPIRDVRELLRGRIKLIRQATQMANRIHGVLTRAGVDYRRAQALGAGAEAWLEGLALSEGPKRTALVYLDALRYLRQRAALLEQEVHRQVNLVEPWLGVVRRLTTIPGVGELSALVLLLELWDLDRFPSAKKLASYAGLVPSVYQTGQTLRGGPLTKQGNAYVRWILVQDAWAAVRCDPRYHGLYRHHRSRLGASAAIIPVARQMLFDLYEIWRDQLTYEDLVKRKQAQRQSA